jgi:hypothetical protein
MKVLLAVMFCMFTLSTISFAQKGAEAAATDAAKQWLSLADAGDAATWDVASPRFKATVTREQWAGMLKAVRAPLGKVLSRTVKTSDYMTSMPGAPDGKYFVIQFETAFENKKSAIETVTPMMGDDGTWRVTGYYVH